jgi:hypothetical protein
MPTKKRTTRKQQAEETQPDSITQSNERADEEAPVKRKHFKKTAQDQLEQSYKEIVTTLAKEAKKGSVRHTKMLLDLGGVKQEVEAVKSKKKRGPSLGKLLLKEVEEMKREASKTPGDENPSS